MFVDGRLRRSEDSWEDSDGIFESPSTSSSSSSSSCSADDRCYTKEELLVLGLLRTENALVKVIKNNDFKQFLDRIGADENDGGIKTSTTLLPANGRKMNLYGQTFHYSVGLIWNINDIDTTSCWCWPAGFYAKTEFNHDPVTNRLLNGLQEALVSLEMLRIKNAQMLNDTNITESPFNEVFAPVTVKSLCGIICRSREYHHLLLAMGVRDTVSRIFQIAPLPIVLHDTQHGVQILTFKHQQEILTDCIRYVQPFASFPVMVGKPKTPMIPLRGDSLPLRVLCRPDDRLVVDIRRYDFTPAEQMKFIGSHGGDKDCIEEVVDHAMERGDYRDAEELILTGLLGAALASNDHSLEAIVRVVAVSVIDHPELYVPSRVDKICNQVKNQDAVLVGLGAYKAIGGVATGEVLGRLHEAMTQIEDWLTHSRQSYLFCLESFVAVSGMEDSSFVPFVSGKAISNRQAFLQNLRELEKRATSNMEPYMRQVVTLIASMHSPCLRLQLLQFILGLDGRWSKQMLARSTCLALEIIKGTADKPVKGNPA